MNIQDGGHDDFVSNKAWYLVYKNDIKYLQKVLKHIESALSNGRSIIFIAISLYRMMFVSLLAIYQGNTILVSTNHYYIRVKAHLFLILSGQTFIT